MSMTKSIAGFLNGLVGKDEAPAISTQTLKAILDFVQENYGLAARQYIRSCFDDQNEDPEGEKAEDWERYICHTLPGEALLDWMESPTPVLGGAVNPSGGGFRG